MSYIGIPPQANFSSGLLDRFTSTTGTTVTLTHDIASENDIVVFVNFVKQDSTTYSVGGTGNKTLTLGGTLVSSDIVEVHYLNIVGQTNAPSSGSVGSSQLSADIITGQTALAVAPDSTDELLISDGGTLKRIDVSLVGGTNTPAFRVTNSSVQSIPNNTWTKVTFDTEDYDTDTAFSSSTFTVPSGKGGKYIFNWIVYAEVDNTESVISRLYVNGSQDLRTYARSVSTASGEATLNTVSVSVTLSASNTVELYMYQNQGGSQNNNVSYTYFSGFRLIGV